MDDTDLLEPRLTTEIGVLFDPEKIDRRIGS